MAHDFDSATMDPGAGGVKVALDEFTDGADTFVMPGGTIAIPDGAGAFHQVGESGRGLPISHNTVKDGSGTDYRPLVDSDGHQQVDVLTAPLPTDAATATAQATINTSVQDVATKIGIVTETAPADDTASSGLNGRLQRIAQRLTTMISSLPASLGQKVKTGSFPVVLASDQDALPVTDNGGSLTVDGTVGVSGLVPGTGATAIGKAEDDPAASGDVGVMALAVRQDTAATTVGADGDYSPLSVDANGRLHVIEPSAATRLSESDFDTKIGALNETAPASDTADSGLNGRLQRIAQRISSLIALLPTALSNGFFQVSLKETITVPVTSTLQAGTALAGKVAAGPDTTNAYDGATALTVVHVNIDTASSGNNAIIAADAAKKFRILSISLFASGAVDIYFNDGTANLLGGTRKVKLDNTGAVGAGGFVLGYNQMGWTQTAAVNRPFNLNLSAAVGVCGTISYVAV